MCALSAGIVLHSAPQRWQRMSDLSSCAAAASSSSSLSCVCRASIAVAKLMKNSLVKEFLQVNDEFEGGATAISKSR